MMIMMKKKRKRRKEVRPKELSTPGSPDKPGNETKAPIPGENERRNNTDLIRLIEPPNSNDSSLSLSPTHHNTQDELGGPETPRATQELPKLPDFSRLRGKTEDELVPEQNAPLITR